MKIYTKIVMDFDGNVTYQESFEYQGSVAFLKGGSSPPPPTEEETELTKQQTELIKQQIEQLAKQNELLDKLYPSLEQYFTGQIDLAQMQIDFQREMMPFQEELAKQGIELSGLQLETLKDEIARNKSLEPVLLDAMGYKKDESGNYVATGETADPIQTQLKQQYEEALSGKTDISPNLEAQIQKQQKTLEEDLSRRLGPDWRNTTPGIQAIEEFNKNADLVREESRRGMVESAGGQYMGYTGLLANLKQQKVGNLLSLTGRAPSVGTAPINIGTTGTSTTGASGLTGLMSGAGSASVSQQISQLRSDLESQRLNPWAIRQGQKAGQNQAMLGGAASGAAVGASISGPYAPIGAAVGLLAGYLLS